MTSRCAPGCASALSSAHVLAAGTAGQAGAGKGSSSTTSGSSGSIAKQAWRCVSVAASPWRGRPALPQRAHEQWALDFLHDVVASGRTIRILSGIAVCTREALALEVATSLPGSRVVRVLDRLAGERPLPTQIVLDHGPEWISRVLE